MNKSLLVKIPLSYRILYYTEDGYILIDKLFMCYQNTILDYENVYIWNGNLKRYLKMPTLANGRVVHLFTCNHDYYKFILDHTKWGFDIKNTGGPVCAECGDDLIYIHSYVKYEF